jgi:hypothetical protein
VVAWGRGAEDSTVERDVEYWSAARAVGSRSAGVRSGHAEEEALRLCCVRLQTADGDRRESA